jgi:glucosamine-6-phosphate deaminase
VEVVIVATADDAARVVADVVIDVLATHDAPVLGLATGTSPLGAYGLLVEACEGGRSSFARASAVLLDEYVGLPADHPQAYRTFIRHHLTDHVDLDPARLHGPDVSAPDVPAACAAYEELLAALGGVDVQLLGIGSDGHVGFNEPSSSLGSRTRIKTLTEQTRRDNARFFDSLDAVPRHVITQGLATIGSARHLVLVATGAPKAAPIAAAVEGPITAMCPASVLQLHPHATVVVDEAAAAALRLADYYRAVSAGKPSWQAL